MLSHPELRHLIEVALLPRASSCVIRHDGSMTIQLIAPITRNVELTVAGIDTATLSSRRAIARLAIEIEEEAKSSCAVCDRVPWHA